MHQGYINSGINFMNQSQKAATFATIVTVILEIVFYKYLILFFEWLFDYLGLSV